MFTGTNECVYVYVWHALCISATHLEGCDWCVIWRNSFYKTDIFIFQTLQGRILCWYHCCNIKTSLTLGCQTAQLFLSLLEVMSLIPGDATLISGQESKTEAHMTDLWSCGHQLRVSCGVSHFLFWWPKGCSLVPFMRHYCGLWRGLHQCVMLASVIWCNRIGSQSSSPCMLNCSVWVHWVTFIYISGIFSIGLVKTFIFVLFLYLSFHIHSHLKA